MVRVGLKNVGIGPAVKRFGRDEEGSLIVFTLFLLLIMFVITGLGVDLMRVETQRTRLQATLDRAILAGASMNQTLNAQTVVLDYFAKSGLPNAIQASDITVSQSATGKSVSAKATMTTGTIFMNMLGINKMPVPAGGTAEESQTDVEISLVVDTSGSMYWNSQSGNQKIEDLKVAAKDFVYLMQCDPDASKPFDGNCKVLPDTVSISLVPYNEQVLLGEDLIQQFNTTEEHASSSCIDFDTADFSTIAVDLDPALISGPPTGPTLRRSATIDPWSNGYQANNNRRTCNPNANRKVAAYQNDYLNLYSAIDALYASGYTSIELGMKWGSALLDPAFRPAVQNMSANLGTITPAFVGRPFNYNRPRTKKVIVLMTDGVNTTQHKVRPGFRDGPSPFYEDASGNVSVFDTTAGNYYWMSDGGHHSAAQGGAQATQLTYPEFWEKYTWTMYKDVKGQAHLPDAVDQIGNSEKNALLDSMCTAAKAQGVTVFTVGFETTAASSQVMQACASTPSHHYDVTGLDITQAFHSIAREIHQLRLTN